MAAYKWVVYRYRDKMEEDGFILVTGGAGYVGTHVLVELIHAGFKPISLDCRGDSVAGK